mgnify:CR=1 FL=1
MGFQQTDLHSLQLLLHYRLKVVRSFLPEHCLLPVRYSAAVMLFWLLLPLLCGVFLVESFSVMMQVGWFKYTKRRYGEGRRILLMSPVHHHYQKKGIFETKIVLRFWIISLLLAAITLVTLKIR